MPAGLLGGVTVQFGGGYQVPAVAYPYRCGRSSIAEVVFTARADRDTSPA